MPDWFVINPTRLPRTSADGCSMKISMPGRTAGADAHAKVAATSRAAVRVMSSVTCYAPRPRLQPRSAAFPRSENASTRGSSGNLTQHGSVVSGSDTHFRSEAGAHGAAPPGVPGPRRVRDGARLHGHVRLLRRPR